MSLNFTNATNNRVDCGSGTSLDNLTTATYLAWVYPTSIVDRRILQKGLFATGYRLFSLDGGNDFYINVRRATSDLVVSSSDNPITTDAWQYLAGVHNTGGANGDQHLYYGDIDSLVAEVASYSLQDVGSGAPVDNGAINQIIGNNTNSNVAFPGYIGWVAIYNKVLTLAQITQQQYKLDGPVTTGCVLFMHLGIHGAGGVGTQADWSGNNNHGTITGATLAAHPNIPIFRRSAQMPYVVAAAGGDPEGSLVGGKLIRGGLLTHGVLVRG